MKRLDPNRRKALSFRVGASLAAAAGGLLTWVLWETALEASLFVAPWLAMAWMAALVVLFLRVYVLPAPWNARGRARSRVRAPARRTWAWVAVMAPAVAALPLALWVVLLALGMARETELPEALRKFSERPGGEVAFYLLVVGVAPLLEEFAFRGWVQRPVERRLGASAAITLSAVLFAIAHFQADYFPVRLAAGLVLGHAVYATRSIWTGVALHGAWNAAVMGFGAAFPDFDPTGKGWAWAAPAAGVALVSLVWCAWGVRQLQDAAAAPPRGARGAAAGQPVESA
jgi:membrane protease YdiL (CAAX protease family)